MVFHFAFGPVEGEMPSLGLWIKQLETVLALDEIFVSEYFCDCLHLRGVRLNLLSIAFHEYCASLIVQGEALLLYSGF